MSNGTSYCSYAYNIPQPTEIRPINTIVFTDLGYPVIGRKMDYTATSSAAGAYTVDEIIWYKGDYDESRYKLGEDYVAVSGSYCCRLYIKFLSNYRIGDFSEATCAVHDGDDKLKYESSTNRYYIVAYYDAVNPVRVTGNLTSMTIEANTAEYSIKAGSLFVNGKKYVWQYGVQDTSGTRPQLMYKDITADVVAEYQKMGLKISGYNTSTLRVYGTKAAKIVVKCVCYGAGTDTAETNSMTINCVETKPAQISSTKNTAKGINISWNKAGDSVKYKLYRRTVTSSWSTGWNLIKETNDTSYLDTNVTSKSNYEYRVDTIILNKKLSSNIVKIQRVVPKATRITSIANVAEGMKVSWDKMADGVTYQVFRKTVGNGWETGWVWLKDVKNNSYTDKAVKNGTVYVYIIKTIYDPENYIFSNEYKYKRVEAPKITGLACASNGVKITFTKVAGATKYQIFRKTIGNGWETGWSWIKDTTNLSYTDTTAEKGKSYVYSVKALSDTYKGALTTSAKITFK